MTFEVKEDFKARTSQGETFFKKGQILDIVEAKAEALVRAGKITKRGGLTREEAERWAMAYLTERKKPEEE